jgi:hypothetical protein
MPSVEELEAQLAEARLRSQEAQNFNSVPTPPKDKYALTTWGETEYDFTTPGGQLCRLRNLPIEEAAASGILDKISRLPGLTAEVVAKAEGAPPIEVDEMPTAETIASLTEVVNVLVPMVVVQPEIHLLPLEGEERQTGLIYVDSIPFPDRVAIMNRTVGDLQRFDNFRNRS